MLMCSVGRVNLSSDGNELKTVTAANIKACVPMTSFER